MLWKASTNPSVHGGSDISVAVHTVGGTARGGRLPATIANEHKSELLSTVSHELRTPLGAIKGYGTALLRFGPRIRATERREFLVAIDQATDRLTSLIDDLLLAQRLEAGALPINPQSFAPASLLEEVVADFTARPRTPGLRCPP